MDEARQRHETPDRWELLSTLRRLITPPRPDVGLKRHARDVGRGIAKREQDETNSHGVLDPSAFKDEGAPSTAARIAAPLRHIATRRGAKTSCRKSN